MDHLNKPKHYTNMQRRRWRIKLCYVALLSLYLPQFYLGYNEIINQKNMFHFNERKCSYFYPEKRPRERFANVNVKQTQKQFFFCKPTNGNKRNDGRRRKIKKVFLWFLFLQMEIWTKKNAKPSFYIKRIAKD